MLNRTFSALADPTRRRILEHLAHGERCVTDLARAIFDVAAGGVEAFARAGKRGPDPARRHGRVHSLKLEAAPMKQASRWIEECRRFWEGSLDRLDDYLKELQDKEKIHERKKQSR